MTELPIIKEAIIRSPDGRKCPYGLEIAISCHNAGQSVDQMQVLDSLPAEKRDRCAASNRKVYRHHQNGERCVYADKIVEGKDFVHCDLGEPGERISDTPMRPAPYYPRVFNGLGQSGLYSWQMGDYTDYSGSYQLFDSLFFAMYASGWKIGIEKVSSKDYSSKYYYEIDGIWAENDSEAE